MFIKAYCVNVVVNIKRIHVKKYTCFRVSLYNYNGKLYSFVAKKMLIECNIQKSLSCKKSLFHWYTESAEIVKIYILNFNVAIFNWLKIVGFL